MNGRSPKKRGLFIGEVAAVSRGRVTVRLVLPLRKGDGIVFDRGRPEEREEGGRVYEVLERGKPRTSAVSARLVELTFGHGAIDYRRLQAGDLVWKTDDPDLTRRLRRSFAGPRTRRRVPLDLHVEARVGERLRLRAIAATGASAEVFSEERLEPAEKHPLDEKLLEAQLGRLGHTAYDLRRLVARIEGAPMVPLSVLGALRHRLLEALEASLVRGDAAVERKSVLASLRASAQGVTPADAATLHVLCRRLDQVEAAIGCGERHLYADFQDIRHYRSAVGLARKTGATLWLAIPRVHKPKETPIFTYLGRLGGCGILARNAAALFHFAGRGIPVVADFSLNAANELSAQVLRELGALRVTVSYDLDHNQLFDLIERFPPVLLEVVIHQHMPMFHMDFCVYCAFLSPGMDRTNCDRPCDTHDVKLRDRVRLEHPLRADVGCRNTLFNAVPQSASEHASRLVARGVRHLRIELLGEGAREVARVVGLYRGLLEGRLAGRDVWSQLNALHHMGVTRGPLGP
ncbi:MAG: DUF3656 domain-containing protein [Planctomycetota bacterium]